MAEDREIRVVSRGFCESSVFVYLGCVLSLLQCCSRYAAVFVAAAQRNITSRSVAAYSHASILLTRLPHILALPRPGKEGELQSVLLHAIRTHHDER